MSNSAPVRYHDRAQMLNSKAQSGGGRIIGPPSLKTFFIEAGNPAPQARPDGKVRMSLIASGLAGLGSEEVAEATISLLRQRDPQYTARLDRRGIDRCLEDINYHVTYLFQSIAVGAPDIFVDYIRWAKAVLETRGIPAADLVDTLECLAAVLKIKVTGSAARAIAPVNLALAVLRAGMEMPKTFLSPGEPHNDLAAEYLAALLGGDRATAGALVLNAANQGLPVREIYLYVFQPTQREVGRLWQTNRISVAAEHYCTAATQLIMSQLYPRIFGMPRIGRTMVAACVAGELHEIGMRMVSDFFELEGWDTYYLGASTPAESLVDTVRDRKADVLAISVMMPTHLTIAANAIATLRARPEIAAAKVLVGGYAFNVSPDIWREIGADACGHDADEALKQAKSLFGVPS